jgi:LuxR family maltose regulon positive regulatory protein
MALTRERDEAAWRYRLKAADAQDADCLRPLVAQAEAFVTLLQRLGAQIDALRPLLPSNDPALAEAVRQLYRQCCEAQTQANLLPLRPDPSRLTSQADRLAALTPSERATLRKIAEGKPNKTIAQELCVTEDTVKFHCKNIFQKLNVPSRTAAAHVWLLTPPPS